MKPAADPPLLAFQKRKVTGQAFVMERMKEYVIDKDAQRGMLAHERIDTAN